MANVKILVVEDEIDIMRATTKCLRSAGHEVVPATDGISATKLAVDEQPNLILLDIGLPAGDGHTVADRLRSNLKTMSIPIIYLTSYGDARNVKKAEQLGAAGYLVKPCDPAKLLKMVSVVLREDSNQPARVGV